VLVCAWETMALLKALPDGVCLKCEELLEAALD
jgi:hypothetical protein